MTKNGKRFLAIVMVLLIMAGALAGCKSTENEEKSSASLFTGDPDALKIFIWGTSRHKEALTEQFPDIKFDFYEYNGINITTSMAALLKRDELGDIHINSLRVTDDDAAKHLLDLSGMTVCDKYEPSMLTQYDVDGGIYQLPGSVSVRCILYNKGMFEKYGWEEPQNFNELVALCRQIREETEDITPMVMGGAAGGYYFTIMTTYSQAEYLYTPEGMEWARKYAEGEASAAEGFDTGFEMTQELIDAGAFDYEKNDGLWDIGIFEERMETNEAAMMFLWGAQDAVSHKIQESSNEYAIMPFRTRDGEAFISNTVSYNLSLAKELGEKGNEKKLEDAKRVIEWLSSGEGIYAITNDAATSIFPLKNEENPYTFKMYRDMWEENLDYIKAPMLYAGYEDVLVPTAEAIMKAVKEEGSLDGITDMMDETHRKFLRDGAEAIEIGSFTEDCTHEETLQILAESIKESGDCDISMVSDGIVKNDVSNKTGGHLIFFEGPMVEEQLTCVIPGDTQVVPCVQLTLSGATIKEMAEKGKYLVAQEDSIRGSEPESEEDVGKSEYFDYYWAGMDVEMKDGKVVSMTLEDGTKMEEDKTYTVAFASGDYSEDVGKEGNPVEMEYTSKDALHAYIQKYSPVEPIEPCR
ncbi:MAG: extracellular solute-binding protein [Clostridiales bacterium]|nr:extracellular solute-binding protein [Clostridiales bacterium]